MKVLIVSDTHRDNRLFIELCEELAPLDMVVHCGDVEGSEYTISEAADCETHIVAGNNDFFGGLPLDKEFEIGRYKVWLTHGHHYYISMGNELLKDEARARGVDIVMYGHTHRPVIDTSGGVIAINPGSLTYPRQEGRRPSYCVMEIDESGEASFKIEYV